MCGRRPAGKLEDGGSDILFEWCRAGFALEAALVQWRAGEVDGDRGLPSGEVDMDAKVRVVEVDRRAAAKLVAKLVDDGILDDPGGEPAVTEGPRHTDKVDRKSGPRTEVVSPGDGPDPGIEGMTVFAGKAGDLQQDAAGHPGPQECPIPIMDRGSEEHGRPQGAYAGKSEGPKLRFENRLQSLGTGGDEGGSSRHEPPLTGACRAVGRRKNMLTCQSQTSKASGSRGNAVYRASSTSAPVG